MREKWKGGKQFCGFHWKTVQVVVNSAYSLLSSEMTMVRKCRVWEQVVDGTRLAGEQENRNPAWSLPNPFANVYIYICCWIVASSLVSCHQGALWHHSASIYCIFSTFGYSSLFQLCIKNMNLLAFSRNNRVDFYVLFFRDNHMSISSLFRVPTGKVILTISIIVVSTVL